MLFRSILLTSIMFFMKVTITKLHLPIIGFITCILYYLLYRKKDKILDIIITYIVSIMIFIVIILCVGKLYDLTVDGNSYHKLAIGCLKNGWNPIYQKVEDFNTDKGNIFDIDSVNSRNFLWVNHYTKGPWIFSAVVYAFTGNIETGKSLTLLMMYIMFSFLFEYLSKKTNIIISIIVPLLLTINPITIVQMFNYYEDGLLGLSVFILIYSLIAITDKEYDKDELWSKFFILACSIIICINIKFTGLAFSGLFCLTFYIYWLVESYRNEERKEFLKKLKLLTIFYFVVVVISVCILGFSSYVKNTFENGHPFYPLYGDGKVDIITTMQPNYFSEIGTLKKFCISIFSKSENICYSYDTDSNKATLKIPFTYSEEELSNFKIPDIRIGGFGPLFSAIFIMSIITIIILIVKCIIKKEYKILVPISLILGCVFLLICIVEGSWWARYTPYLYIIPIISILYLLTNKSKLINIAGIILSLIILINTVFIWNVNSENYINNSKYINGNLKRFEIYVDDKKSKNENIEIKLKDEAYQSVLYNLDDLGINVKVNNQIEAKNDGYFFEY